MGCGKSRNIQHVSVVFLPRNGILSHTSVSFSQRNSPQQRLTVTYPALRNGFLQQHLDAMKTLLECKPSSSPFPSSNPGTTKARYARLITAMLMYILYVHIYICIYNMRHIYIYNIHILRVYTCVYNCYIYMHNCTYTQSSIVHNLDYFKMFCVKSSCEHICGERALLVSILRNEWCQIFGPNRKSPAQTPQTLATTVVDFTWSLVFCKTSRFKRVVELRKSTGTSENLQEKAVLQIFHGEQTWSCPQISSRFTAFPTRHGSMFSVRTQLNNDLTQSYLIS